MIVHGTRTILKNNDVYVKINFYHTYEFFMSLTQSPKKREFFNPKKKKYVIQKTGCKANHEKNATSEHV